MSAHIKVNTPAAAAGRVPARDRQLAAVAERWRPQALRVARHWCRRSLLDPEDLVALAEAGYPFVPSALPPYPRDRRAYMLDYNHRPDVRARRLAGAA